MKLSLEWIKDFVDLDENLNPQEIADKLSTSGFEIEEVLSMGCKIEGIVIGRVLDCQKHPNAEKLNICQVDIGSEETQIICGAPNVAKGQTVPVATVGTDFGSGLVIKKAKLRGEESNGMICSEAELGISHEADGIMCLETDLPSGSPISEYFTNVDTQFDLAITPNRPDCLNHLGIAKELSVMYNTNFKDLAIQKNNAKSSSLPFSLDVKDGSACERFTASLIKGVAIAESPDWLKRRLATIGLRSINNLVDISNYVMFEIGQPMHFYDYDKIDGAKLIVRSAKDGEVVRTLDDKERTLTSESTLIEDETKFAGIAGVMGGKDTEVSDSTVNVLIEAAIWDRVRIQRSQRDLTLITDASYRYSKGVDFNLPLLAQERAIELILELCGGELTAPILDYKMKEVEKHSVSFRKERCDMLLGKTVENSEIERIFKGLSFEKITETEWNIPTNRQDIIREVDLIEEVARIIGLDNIKGKKELTINYAIDENREDRQIDDLKSFLVHKGIQEFMSNSMVSKSLHQEFSQKEAVEILNPISDESNVLRTSLVPSMLKMIDFNIKHKRLNLACFEINKDYQQKKKKVAETRKLLVALSGNAEKKHWSQAERAVDFYDIKGLAEELLRYFSLDSFSYAKSDQLFLSEEALKIEVNSNAVGFFGKIDSSVKKKMKLSQTVYILELNLDQLLSLQGKTRKSIKEINRFPVVERDIAVIVDKSYTAEEMLVSIQNSCGELLTSLEIFDLYSDKTFKKNEHSIAFKLHFSANRTLREEEVDPLFRRAIEDLNASFNAYLRDGK